MDRTTQPQSSPATPGASPSVQMTDSRLAPFSVLVSRAWETWVWLLENVWPLALASWTIAIAFPTFLAYRGLDSAEAHPQLALASFLFTLAGGILLGAILPLSALLLLRGRNQPGVTVEHTFLQSFSFVLPFFFLNFLVVCAILGGFILLIIPGILFSIRLSMAAYALVFEDRRGMEALLRSIGLVRGSTKDVFATFFAFGATALFVMMLLMSFTFEGSDLRNAPDYDPTGDVAFLVGGLWEGVLDTLFIMLQLAMGYAIFEDLRIKKGDAVADDQRQLVEIAIGIGISVLLIVFVGAFVFRHQLIFWAERLW